MKRIVLMSMMMAGLLCAGPLAALDNKGPKIEIKELRHDFGKVVQGTKAEYVFEVKNAGSEQLVIEKVQPSWGCTAVVISSDHLDPGVVGRVKATVATANIIGPSLKHISVYSNDRTTPVLTVEVAIDVVPDDASQKSAAPSVAKPVVAAPTGTAPK